MPEALNQTLNFEAELKTFGQFLILIKFAELHGGPEHIVSNFEKIISFDFLFSFLLELLIENFVLDDEVILLISFL